jgi:ABC-type nitrate/sulfonate/bicarbonate transport system ATPase subunit
MTYSVSLQKVEKQFDTDAGRVVEVLNGISLNVRPGEFVALVGASGCGKSTLLRLIVGLENPNAGSVEINGVPVRGPSHHVGMIFQDHRLFPWLTVIDNVLLGMEHVAETPARRREIVFEQLELVGLKGVESYFPRQLSGSMAQRAAIARALAAEPEILLLDEPFGALDAFTKLRLQQELHTLWQRSAKTMILVTHDVEESVFLADRVIVLQAHPGRILAEIPNPLAHPRDRALPEFQAIRKDVVAQIMR